MSLAGFDIVEPIGSGGFSRVYRAHQRDLGRDVALKVLTVDMETPAQRRAFERECRATGALAHHPSIVSVFTSTFTEDGRPCIVMEYFAAGTFADLLRRSGPLDAASVLRVGVELSAALQTAHDHGVVHRDIKPSNLFVSAFGGAVLGDFGISSIDDDRTITGGGGLTVHFAPPELIEGEPASVASDIYSLAATLFTLASDEKPHPRGPGQTTADLARRILLEPTPRLDMPEVPAALVDVLERAMAKRPEHRPASAVEFGRALQQIQVELGLDPTPLVVAGHEAVRLEASAPRHTAAGAEVSSSPRSWATSGNRRITAAALGALAIVALASTAVALGDRGAHRPVDVGTDAEDAATATATTRPESTDEFFAAPRTPNGIDVAVDTEGRTLVSWSAADDGSTSSYQVEVVGNDVVVETSDTRVVLETMDTAVCVVVRAVGEGGRLSADSDPVCGSG